jgi:hypothetical protein
MASPLLSYHHVRLTEAVLREGIDAIAGDRDRPAKCLRLLKAIKAKTANSGQLVFVVELAHDLKMSGGEAQGAFRYLSDRRWADTFIIPYGSTRQDCCRRG